MARPNAKENSSSSLPTEKLDISGVMDVAPGLQGTGLSKFPDVALAVIVWGRGKRGLL